MSINPTLATETTTQGLFPLPLTGETFVLKRDGIGFECLLPSGHKLRGNGCFFLSSQRIVFISTSWSSRADFKSFQVKLSDLLEPKFQQPAFGANYLGGKAKPSISDEGSALLGGVPAPFSLTFNEGGCGTFLGIFFKLMKDIDNERGPSSEAVQDAIQVAYVDPNDPSTLYLSQPAPSPGTEEDTKLEVTYEPGEIAEVKIIEGRYTGNWVKCSINGPGDDPHTYNIHILPTKDYDEVGGYSDTDSNNISTEHLRKAGDTAKNRPGPCGFETCAVQ